MAQVPGLTSANVSQQCRHRSGFYLCQQSRVVPPPTYVHASALQGAVYDLVTPCGTSTGFVLKILNTRTFAMCTGIMQNFERVSGRPLCSRITPSLQLPHSLASSDLPVRDFPPAICQLHGKQDGMASLSPAACSRKSACQHLSCLGLPSIRELQG